MSFDIRNKVILLPKAEEGFIELYQCQVNSSRLEATYCIYPWIVLSDLKKWPEGGNPANPKVHALDMWVEYGKIEICFAVHLVCFISNDFI